MEKQLKLLYSGRKGILLKKLPETLDDLFQIIEKYFKVDTSKIQITFKDTEKDECEVLDNETYYTACSEFNKKVVFTVTAYNSVPISRINPIKIRKNTASLKYLKKNTRKMAIFDLDSSTTQWITFQPGIIFKEFSAWVELPSGDIFVCGGGHPISSPEVFLLNPYTQTYKKLPNMNTARHSHGILYKDGFVYVFGGMRYVMFFGDFLNHCERFSLKDFEWQDCEMLNCPVADSAAVLYKDEIYVTGKGSKGLCGLNNKTLIDIGNEEGACVVVKDCFVFIFKGDKVVQVDLNLGKVSKTWPICNKSWWSHSPPVVFKQFIYFVWWQEPGWICRWDSEKGELNRIVSFFN